MTSIAHAHFHAEFRNVYFSALLGHGPSIVAFDARYGRYFLKLFRRYLHPRLLSIFDPEDLRQDLYQKLFAEHNPATVGHCGAQWQLVRRIAVNLVLELNRSYLDTVKRDLRRERHMARLPEWKSHDRSAAFGFQAAGHSI